MDDHPEGEGFPEFALWPERTEAWKLALLALGETPITEPLEVEVFEYGIEPPDDFPPLIVWSFDERWPWRLARWLGERLNIGFLAGLGIEETNVTQAIKEGRLRMHIAAPFGPDPASMTVFLQEAEPDE